MLKNNILVKRRKELKDELSKPNPNPTTLENMIFMYKLMISKSREDANFPPITRKTVWERMLKGMLDPEYSQAREIIIKSKKIDKHERIGRL